MEHTVQNETDLALSVVIPILNERESIEPLSVQIGQVISELDLSYEIIFVDDGSSDGSFSMIEQLHESDSRIKGIKFRHNVGKSAALTAGFRKAAGTVVITMDADLQDNPADIPAFLKKLGEGYDLVSGWKKKRRDPWTRRVASRIFNMAVCHATGLRLHDINCGFKAYRREVVQQLRVYGDLHRYLPAFAQNLGFKVGELVVHHRPRQFGKSRYGKGRYLRAFFDLFTVLLLTRYRNRPLHFFGKAALTAVIIGILLWVLAWGMTALWPNWTWWSEWGLVFGFVLGMVFLLAVPVLVSAGLLAELLVAREPDILQDSSIERELS